MRVRPVLTALALAALALVGSASVGSAAVGRSVGVRALAQVADSFPHADHEGLFPLCAGCHVGIETGVRDNFYPDPSVCARCHDGQREPTVE